MNIDYIGVTFDNMPAGMTPTDLFNALRGGFQSMEDECNSTFNFNDHGDGNTWHSSDPLGAIFDIDILGDDGSVVVSDYENGGDSCLCWTFSTITTSFPVTGSHPVSGNRQFGLTQNADGSWTFYTRGIDRLVLPGFYLGEYVAYSAGDKLWDCVMSNISSYLSKIGTESQSFNHSVRPNWALVRNQILSTNISELLECIQK